MHFTLALLASSLLGITAGIPLPTADSTPISDTAIPKIDDPEYAPGTILIEPPPLFDPSEPRPEPLFGLSPSRTASSDLKRAPIQQYRAETLLPFDGAHVHPYTTPYTPERLPETCAYIFNCQAARTSLEITGFLAVLCLLVYMLVYVSSRVVRRILRSAKTRNRSPSGSLRLEPEVGTKTSLPQLESVSTTATAPLVQVLSEKDVLVDVC